MVENVIFLMEHPVHTAIFTYLRDGRRDTVRAHVAHPVLPTQQWLFYVVKFPSHHENYSLCSKITSYLRGCIKSALLIFIWVTTVHTYILACLLISETVELGGIWCACAPCTPSSANPPTAILCSKFSFSP